jgi:hypothetical protein
MNMAVVASGYLGMNMADHQHGRRLDPFGSGDVAGAGVEREPGQRHCSH